MKNLDYKKNKCSGFTLIEVLIATIILVASLAAISLLYRGALISSEKATTHIEASGYIPSILASIRQEIQHKGSGAETEVSGVGQAWELGYVWQAKMISFMPPAPIFSPDSGVDEHFPNKYKLWEVELTIKLKSLEKTYSFNELSWTND